MNNLLETLIAAFIFVLLFSLAQKQFTAMEQASLLAQNKAQALLAVRAEMEKLNQISPERLPEYDGQSFSANKGNISVQFLSADLLSISISYNWREKNKPIELVTIRERR